MGGLRDLFLVAQVADPAAAQADLTSLSQLLPPTSVSSVSIGGAPFLQTVIDDTQPLTYGVAGGWLYAVSGDAESVIDQTGGSLEPNPRYATLRSALGSGDLSGFVFVDVQGVRELTTSLLAAQQQADYQAGVRPLVAPLTFFGGGTRSEANGDSHAHFVLGIQKP